MKSGMKVWKGLVAALVLTVMTGCLGGCSFWQVTNYVYQNGEKYTAGDRSITEKIETIDVDYLDGDVRLVGTDAAEVSIRETAGKELSEKQKVHTWVDGTTLYVRFCASAKGLDLFNLKKHLEISIPKDVKLSGVKVEISSGDLNCSDFEANDVKVSSSSGNVAGSFAAGKIKISASSGDITLNQNGSSDEISLSASSGQVRAEMETVGKLNVEVSSGKIFTSAKSVKECKARSSSGSCEFRFEETPEKCDIGASSGNVNIYLPEKADVTADFELSSGKLYYEQAFTKKGDSYVCGSGANQLKVETSSGDVNVKLLVAE